MSSSGLTSSILFEHDDDDDNFDIDDITSYLSPNVVDDIQSRQGCWISPIVSKFFMPFKINLDVMISLTTYLLIPLKLVIGDGGKHR